MVKFACFPSPDSAVLYRFTSGSYLAELLNLAEFRIADRLASPEKVRGTLRMCSVPCSEVRLFCFAFLAHHTTVLAKGMAFNSAKEGPRGTEIIKTCSFLVKQLKDSGNDSCRMVFHGESPSITPRTCILLTWS